MMIKYNNSSAVFVFQLNLFRTNFQISTNGFIDLLADAPIVRVAVLNSLLFCAF